MQNPKEIAIETIEQAIKLDELGALRARPIVVAYGAGLDSTALLVEMHNRGIRPDLILFADVGGENPETYFYLWYFSYWLESVGFPPVTIVRYQPTTAPYTTLEGKCLANGVLPSPAMGQHQCAIIFKRDQQVKFLKQWKPGLEAIAAGGKITQAIGFDDSAQDRKRSKKADVFHEKARTQDVYSEKTGKTKLSIEHRLEKGLAPLSDQWQSAHCDFVYPLQDWNLERAELAKIIEAEGLAVPRKSACFFCPSNQPSEVVELKLAHPDLFARALAIEEKAQAKLHKPRGMAMGRWYWKDLADIDDPSQAAPRLRELGFKVNDQNRL